MSGEERFGTSRPVIYGMVVGLAVGAVITAAGGSGGLIPVFLVLGMAVGLLVARARR